MITTVVGNYPKIPDLPAPGKWRSAVERFQKGELDEAALREVEDEVTVEAIQAQVNAGIDLITDGQIRWEDAQTYFARRLRGFSIDGLQRYFDTNVYFRQPVAEAEITWAEPIVLEDFKFALAHSSKPVKPVITGPFTLAKLSQHPRYGSFRDLVNAIARALNRELRELEAAGAEIIQVDEPALCRHKQDYPLFAEAMRVLTAGISTKKVLCTYFGDIGGLYPQLLDLPFEVIGLDFVAGYRNWEVIKHAPFTKELAFGILDARNTRLEPVDEVVSAIQRITEVVPPDRLQISPSAGLEFLPHGVANRKLHLLTEAARAARRTLKGVRT